MEFVCVRGNPLIKKVTLQLGVLLLFQMDVESKVSREGRILSICSPELGLDGRDPVCYILLGLSGAVVGRGGRNSLP